MKAAFPVLGFHPSSRGFGWVLFEAPDSIFDWGSADIRAQQNALVLRRLRELLDKYGPLAIALEAYADQASQRSMRIRHLCDSIVSEARTRGIFVQICSRAAIHSVFTGATTRRHVAVAIAKRFAPLEPRLQKARKAWESERPNEALFAAAACAVTYYAMCAPGP